MRALNRRKGIASLPVVIIFIALVAVGFYAASGLISGQGYLSNQQLTIQDLLTARQQELSGLKVSGGQTNVVQIEQTASVTTTIDKVLFLFSNGSSRAFSININIPAGSQLPTNLNVTSLVKQYLGSLPNGLSSITLVTSRGVYITSQVQVSAQQKAVTQQTTEWNVWVTRTITSPGRYICSSGVLINGTYSFGNYACQQSYSATQLTQYNCPSAPVVQTAIGPIGGSGTLTWVNNTPYCAYPEFMAVPPQTQYNPGYYSCPPGWTLQGSSCTKVVTIYVQVIHCAYEETAVWHPGYYTYNQVTVRVWHPGYYTYETQWVPVYHPGYYTYQPIYHSGYYTYQRVYYLGHYIYKVVYHPGYYTYQPVYHPGYYTLKEQIVPVWHPGYYTYEQQTVPVWHPGYYTITTTRVCMADRIPVQITETIPATWNPPSYTNSCNPGWTLGVNDPLDGAWCYYPTTELASPVVYFTYQCNSGDQLSGTTCYHMTPAQYQPPQTAYIQQYVGTMSSCPTSVNGLPVSTCDPVTVSSTYTVTEQVLTEKTSWTVGG